MRVLVTGGVGFIGSHICVELLNAGYDVLIIDNLVNSHQEKISEINLLTNKLPIFCLGDIRDTKFIKDIMSEFKPSVVIHLAGLKSVSSSLIEPVEYYDVNVSGGLQLLNEMSNVDCTKMVFSSSATVYGEPKYLPIDENHPTLPTNPYGVSKLMFEQILRDWVRSNKENQAVCLRYFNPVGSHPSGFLGEQPKLEVNNLMPTIVKVAAGRANELKIFGDDYNTLDGTAERDYLHVVDLAYGHLCALRNLGNLDPFQVLNLGTGQSLSVMKLVSEFEKTTGQRIPTSISPRRIGDAETVFANASLAESKIGFKCKKSLKDYCRDSWLAYQNIV